MTCWRRRDGRSEGSAGVFAGSGGLISEEGGGDEIKMSSRELSMAVVSERVEVMVVVRERGAEGVEAWEFIIGVK